MAPNTGAEQETLEITAAQFRTFRTAIMRKQGLLQDLRIDTENFTLTHLRGVRERWAELRPGRSQRERGRDYASITSTLVMDTLTAPDERQSDVSELMEAASLDW
ncbi:hypothetical protein [[Kitasatospora] papulosa]|uniref:hypothetical protein n=1 Tax=[Kitasatospora] papulosa TaxID=1464011 RepID=UPI00362A8C1C